MSALHARIQKLAKTFYSFKEQTCSYYRNIDFNWLWSKFRMIYKEQESNMQL